MQAVKLSIVTTLYKSKPYIQEFVRRSVSEVQRITDDYEIVMVDDGSPDESLKVALECLAVDPRIRIIELSRNFGHHKAMMTGIENAGGDHIFLIDVDLEEPPELLGHFYTEMQRARCDVVYGFQDKRKGSWMERHLGRLAWHLIDLCMPVRVPRNHSTVRLMTAVYARSLVQHKEHKTAIGGLWVLTGFKQKGLPFAKGSRRKSSYTLRSRLTLLLDSITSFSELPLYAVFILGTAIMCISAVFGMWLVILRLLGHLLEGWASTMVSIWFLGGLAIFSIGLVGLYVSRIFIETKQRPYTIIRNIHDKTRSNIP